jgi:hypothetical protein
MRYEHIVMDISTATCAVLEMLIEKHLPDEIPGRTCNELVNLANELRARLQRTDIDVHAVQS